MKKFYFVMFSIIAMLMAYNIDVKAETPSSLSELIDNYGIAGQREIIQRSSNPISKFGIESSNGKVLTIYNSSNGKILSVSNEAYVIYNEQYAHQTMNIGNSVAFANVNQNFPGLSSIFSDTTGNYYHYLPTGSGALTVNNCDIKYDGTTAGFNSYLEQYPNNPNDPNNPDTNNLPMLKYGLTKKTVIGFPQITQIKEILTWDYTSENVYRNNPTDFHMEMVASARWTSSPTGIGNIRDTSDKSINQNCKVYITNGGCNISANQYSWIYREIGKSLYAIAGEPWDDNSGYFMYVRTVQDSTGISSAWKVYNLALNGVVVQEDIFIEPDGTQKSLPNSQKDIGNGDGVQPAKFDNDSSTSSESDPTSIRYDNGSGNFNAGTVIATLKNTVNQVGELPSVLTQLLSFLPSWLTSLIVIGIGLAVTIGIVKMILH